MTVAAARARRRPATVAAARALLVTLCGTMVACMANPGSTPLTSITAPPSVAVSGGPPESGASSAPSQLPASIPQVTPAPSYALALPDQRDSRTIAVDVEPSSDGLLVTVSSLADQRIDEIVLRWSSDLNDVFFIAPFVPSAERIRDGGSPLVQEWTKWVVGPGERGEPAGTTSLGYGPLMARATLEIPLYVDRRIEGPVAFDLQLLAGNDLLSLEGGDPAALRIEVP